MATTGDTAPFPFPLHAQGSAVVRATPESAFAFLDTHENIAAHMNRPSWAMLGGTMTTSLDEFAGKRVGSVINIRGKVLGIPISLAEKIVQRVPPRCKRWETIGTPQLIVIGAYRMGFDLEPASKGCRVTVSIDYELPRAQPGRLLGRLLGPAYARWCVERVIQAVAHAFGGTKADHAS
jgi:Polyketide cyclase / dehydrase and lipid transport